MQYEGGSRRCDKIRLGRGSKTTPFADAWGQGHLDAADMLDWPAKKNEIKQDQQWTLQTEGKLFRAPTASRSFVHFID